MGAHLAGCRLEKHAGMSVKVEDLSIRLDQRPNRDEFLQERLFRLLAQRIFCPGCHRAQQLSGVRCGLWFGQHGRQRDRHGRMPGIFLAGINLGFAVQHAKQIPALADAFGSA